jgi:hypothetical protein
MRYRLAIVALLMIASSAAEADPHMGIGGNTCAVFAKEYQSNPQIENFYTTWAAGFMSGVNVMLDASGRNSTDITAMSLSDKQQFLRSFCQENPLSQYLEGVFALMKTMPKFKLKAH